MVFNINNNVLLVLVMATITMEVFLFLSLLLSQLQICSDPRASFGESIDFY